MSLPPTNIPDWPSHRVRNRVAKLSAGDWPASRNLELVESIIRGGLDRAAIQIGIDRDACLDRWNMLFPEGYRGRIGNQVKLLLALRDAAASEVSTGEAV